MHSGELFVFWQNGVRQCNGVTGGLSASRHNRRTGQELLEVRIRLGLGGMVHPSFETMQYCRMKENGNGDKK